MDKAAVTAMLALIVARLERRIGDPRFTQSPGEGLCWEQAAGVVYLEADMAGISRGDLDAAMPAARAEIAEARL